MNRKGVCYDVGRVMLGSNWRPNFDPVIVHRELEIIKNDLHCNSVRICGLDIDRLVAASGDALAQGLEVWFSPEMWDRGQEETLRYLNDAAIAAESLRQSWPGRLVFSVGSELTLFMQGIVEGANVFERMNKPSFMETVRSGRHNGNLNAFLQKANKAVKEVFDGPVTYFSVSLETVDWAPFDFVGVDLYRDARTKDIYGKMVQRYKVYNKPVIIGEFGCCTYQGAEKLGGLGFMLSFGMMADLFGRGQVLPRGSPRRSKWQIGSMGTTSAMRGCRLGKSPSNLLYWICQEWKERSSSPLRSPTHHTIRTRGSTATWPITVW